jgi:hypothetical protein
VLVQIVHGQIHLHWLGHLYGYGAD